LDKAYRQQAKFCVIFASEDYERKLWTKFEMERARARSFFQKNQAYILPYLLDDSDFARGFMSVGCLTYRTHDEDKLAKAIRQKLNRRPERRLIIWLKDLYRIKSRLAATIILIMGGSAIALKDQFTPVNALTEDIYKRDGREISGSMCKDTTFSFSQGRGTCSHHGGVWYKVDTVIHNKTMEQCKEEAKRTSLFLP
jgi:vacuolar-type H+-ATPase subunit F/Vma7